MDIYKCPISEIQKNFPPKKTMFYTILRVPLFCPIFSKFPTLCSIPSLNRYFKHIIFLLKDCHEYFEQL